MSIVPSSRSSRVEALLVSLVVSFVAHQALVAGWVRAVAGGEAEPVTRRKKARPSQPMRVRLVQGPRKDLARKKTPFRQAPRPKKKEKKPDETPTTYVKLSRPDREVTPEKTRLSSRFAAKVKKQMVKRGTRGGSMISSGARMQPGRLDAHNPRRVKPIEETKPPVQSPDAKPTEKPSKHERARTELRPEPGRPASPTLLVRPRSATGRKKGPRNDETAKAQRAVDAKALFPSAHNTHASQLGNNGMINFLKLPDGERTMLSRKRNRYWAFFERMERQLRREWGPVRVMRQHDPRGDRYGFQSRRTVLQITLKSDGALHKMTVAKSSGLDFFDDEAVRAFNKAAPFPNPPEGLKDEDGLIHFRFGFYLQFDVGGEPLFIFRPQPPNLPGM